ncbi:MAG: DNA-binding response regulator [Bacteroidia bacterium]|nr:MAG: DNA-binding response regulator [Bacteroidia bacterium]
MIKVVIVDDVKTIQEALRLKIQSNPDFEILGVYNSGKEILRAIQQGLKPDIILMDIDMPEMNGIEATEKIMAINPNIKILMCTVHADENSIFKSVCAGAKGYLLKDESIEKISRYIFETLEGGSAMSPGIALKALNLIKNSSVNEINDNSDYKLTSREIEIIRQIAAGLTYDQVADNCGISYGTVRKHIENIYRKLNAHGKVDAINKAKKGGIL